MEDPNIGVENVEEFWMLAIHQISGPRSPAANRRTIKIKDTITTYGQRHYWKVDDFDLNKTTGARF